LVLPIISNPLIMLGLGVVFSFLLVSEIPMFSLKAKSLKWKGNELRIIFVGLFLFFLLTLNITAFPLILLVYIIFSAITAFNKKPTS